MESPIPKQNVLHKANPLIVFSKRDTTIENFCREKKIAFEVVEDSFPRAVEKVRRIAHAGNHTSVMLSSYMPALPWELVDTKEKVKSSSPSDIAYMLSDDGTIVLPVSRLPQKPQVAVTHLQRMFEPIEVEETPKVTIFYALPELGKGYHLLRNNLSLISFFGFIHNLESMSLKVRTFPFFAEDKQEDLEYLLDSSVGITLDYQSYQIGPNLLAHSAVHGSGEGLTYGDGRPIITREQFRTLRFKKYPLLWLGGCHSASPRLTQVIAQTGAALVGNTNYGYSQPWVYEGSHIYTRDIISLIKLQRSPTYGEAYRTALDDVAEGKDDWRKIIHKILNNGPISLRPDEDHAAIYILNHSLCGNTEAPSPLYISARNRKGENAHQNVV